MARLGVAVHREVGSGFEKERPKRAIGKYKNAFGFFHFRFDNFILTNVKIE